MSLRRKLTGRIEIEGTGKKKVREIENFRLRRFPNAANIRPSHVIYFFVNRIPFADRNTLINGICRAFNCLPVRKHKFSPLFPINHLFYLHRLETHFELSRISSYNKLGTPQVPLRSYRVETKKSVRAVKLFLLPDLPA